MSSYDSKVQNFIAAASQLSSDELTKVILGLEKLRIDKIKHSIKQTNNASTSQNFDSFVSQRPVYHNIHEINLGSNYRTDNGSLARPSMILS